MKLYVMFIVVLLLSFQRYEAEGTRLGRVLTLSASSNEEIIKISSIKRSNQDHELVAKTDEVPSSTALKNRRSLSRVVIKKSHHHVDHWLPKIHEDYYGPKHHRPRHH